MLCLFKFSRHQNEFKLKILVDEQVDGVFYENTAKDNAYQEGGR